MQAFKDHVKEFYPQGALVSESYAGIVSEPHLKRLKSILDRTKGDVAIGGQVDEKKLRFEPTIVADVKDGDSLMEEYVFEAFYVHMNDFNGIFHEAKYLVLFFQLCRWRISMRLLIS